jgi:type VI protein secretion system component VasK
VPDSASSGRAATFTRRFWWLYVVIGVCLLAVAACRTVERSDGWAVSAGIWVVIGLSQLGIGLLGRRESLRAG